ncbi:hypothetical protein EPN52_08060 [bacterium]|nr:MAG: hypothetical protein EPN52_08060 [bacterium]
MDPLAQAARLGLRVEIEDFGAAARFVAAEYDPHARAIYVNARLLCGSADRAGVLAACVAHELYHHLEHAGAVPCEPDKRRREERADAYARRSFALTVDPASVRRRLRR